jgi:hypothetical protein
LSEAIAGQPLPERSSACYGAAVPEHGVATGEWTVRNRDALEWSRLFSARQGDWQRERITLQATVRSSADELRRERAARCDAFDEVSLLTETLVVEKAAREAAQSANGEIVERVIEQSRSAEALRDHAEEWAALQSTKLLRWTRPARSIYASALRGKRR